MGVTQGSTLYGGSVSSDAIHQISQGEGFTWAPHVRTEILVGGKPRQLTKAKHNGNPLTENKKRLETSDFTGGAGMVFNGRQLSVTSMMVPDEFDVEVWKQTFPEFQPKGNLIDLKANPKIQKAVFDLIMEATKTQVNILHSAGDTTAGGASPIRFYDGFETLILADGDAVQAGDVPAAVTLANAEDQMFDLRDAVKPELRNHKDLKIFCSHTRANLFDRAARESNTAETTVLANGVRVITNTSGSSIPVIPQAGLSRDFAFATIASTAPTSNLVQGVWIKSDEDLLKMFKEHEGNQVYDLLMRFDMGVQYKTGEDIVYLNNV